MVFNAANEWYSTPSKKGLVELDDKFGFSLNEFMTWFDGDAKVLIDVLGPTPTVGGAIPKLPLSIDRNGWDGRIGLPTRFGDTGRTDILLKLENTSQYPGIIELEALGLTVHKEAGFDVPRFWPVKVKSLNAIAIERFDRTDNGSTVFMESIYSVLASGNRKITNHYSTSYDHIGLAIDSPDIQITSDRKAAKKHLLDRLILSMLTGNGDLHLENLSIIEREGTLSFSPVYDPVPMRAYSIHNALFPTGMGFGDYADEINNKIIDFNTAYLRFSKNLGINKTTLQNNKIIDFNTAYLRFSKNLGINKTTLQNSIEHLLKVTDDYDKKINSLETLPAENKTNLIKIHKNIREKYERF